MNEAKRKMPSTSNSASRTQVLIGSEEVSPQRALTKNELSRLEHCESIIQRGLDTFFEVGIALLTIRDGRLYRAKSETFDSYCHERWGIGSSYARRVIRAAERIKLLPENGTIPRPTSEFQMRPFLQLDAEVFPTAWQELMKRSSGGKISPASVKELVAEFSTNLEPRNTPKQRKQGRSRFGEVFVWLHEARKRVQNGETEQALAAIERIEDVVSRYL